MTGAPLLAITAAALLLSGCGNLFHADFESDVTGQTPDTSPPGPPPGDSISNGPVELFFVTEDNAISGEKSLSIRESLPSLEPGANRTTFRTADISDPDAPIYITWRGHFPSDQGGVRINAGVLGQFFGNVTFENGQINLMFDTSVGSYQAGGTHTALLSLFPASQTFRFTLFGEADLDDEFAEAPLTPIDGEPSNEGFVELVPTASSAQNLVYIIDDVTISNNAP